MSIFGKFWNGYLTINAVDLSARVKSAVLTHNGEILDITCMGNSSKAHAPGIKNWALVVEFEDDLAASGAGSVDATLRGLVGAAAVAMAFRLDSGAISTTNPEAQGNVLVPSVPFGGAHGQPLRKNMTFQGTGDLTFDVTP